MAERQVRRAALERHQRAVVYRLVGRILTIGFWPGVTLLFTGITLALLRGDRLPTETDAPGDVFPAALRLDAEALVELGILFLLLTPLSYVVTLLVTYILQRDRAFAAICFALVALIAGSVGLALR